MFYSDVSQIILLVKWRTLCHQGVKQSMMVYTITRLLCAFSLVVDRDILRLPCTFRGVSSLTDVAHAPYIADILTPYQIKAYKICYRMIAIFFDSNEFLEFFREFLATHLRGRYDHLSRALIQSDFCFSIIRFFPGSPDTKRVFFVFDSSEKLCNVL